MEMEPSTSSAAAFDYSDRCGNYQPGFANLPMEIILKIFRYLNFYDIQAASLACRRWLQASESNEFQTKVFLKILRTCLDDTSIPGELFVRTLRCYHNLYLDETNFGSLQGFFHTLSKTVNKLIFISSDITNRQFYRIVRQLPNINDLTIENCTSLFMAGQFLESENDRDFMKDWFHHIKKLSLRKNQYLSDAILIRMTTLINCIEKLDLCGCHVAYHTAIQRRFYPPDLANTPSESILTFKFVLRVIESHASTINELDLSHTLVGGSSLETLSRTNSLILKIVKFNFCRQLNRNGLQLFTELQRNIIELNISNCDGITDACIKLVTDNLLLLEKFYLRRCRKLTNLSSTLLARARKLKVLDISLCDGMSTDGYLNDLVKNKNTCLEELYMVAIDVCEECIIQIATNLINLRVLDIGHCINGVTNISVQAITVNLKLLRSLDLEGCILVNDDALTGINIKPTSPNQRSTSSSSGGGCTSSIYVDGFYIDPRAQSEIKFTPPLKEQLPTLSPSTVDNEDASEGASSLPLIAIPPIPTPPPPMDGRNNIRSSMKICLRSTAEEEIVQDTEKRKAIKAIYVLSNNKELYGVQLLRGLQSINLQGCKVSDISLEVGLKFLELRRIILANCTQLTDTGIQYLIKNCPAIEDLDISDCAFSDRSIQYIAKGFKRLRILNISGCRQLSNHSIDSIIVHCKYLQCLSLNRCTRINADSDFIMRNIPTLRNINIDRSSTYENVISFK